jgi:hypothetical protein
LLEAAITAAGVFWPPSAGAAGEVFQAAVDLDGDHAVGGAQPGAMLMAAARLAPVEGPEKMPSVRAAWRAVWNACAWGMATTWS